jgi:hypothetical protein
MYDQYGESSLNYHELVTEFLDHLCSRTKKGEPTPAPAPTPSPPAAPGTPTTPETHNVVPPPPPVPIPGDALYCSTAQRFTTDLHTPPAIALLSRNLRVASRAGVQMSLSKISTVSLTVRRGANVVWHNAATVERGRPRLLWVTPSAAGVYTVTLVATDPAGNFASTSGTVSLGH